MTTHKSKDVNFTEAQLRVLLDLAREETRRLGIELAWLADEAYHWSDGTARELRMRKRVTEAIEAKVVAAVQGWRSFAEQEQVSA